MKVERVDFVVYIIFCNMRPMRSVNVGNFTTKALIISQRITLFEFLLLFLLLLNIT